NRPRSCCRPRTRPRPPQAAGPRTTGRASPRASDKRRPSPLAVTHLTISTGLPEPPQANNLTVEPWFPEVKCGGLDGAAGRRHDESQGRPARAADRVDRIAVRGGGGMLKQLCSSLTEGVDRRIGWDKLPWPLGLLVVLGLRFRLRAENLFDSGRGPLDVP